MTEYLRRNTFGLNLIGPFVAGKFAALRRKTHVVKRLLRMGEFFHQRMGYDIGVYTKARIHNDKTHPRPVCQVNRQNPIAEILRQQNRRRQGFLAHMIAQDLQGFFGEHRRSVREFFVPAAA